MRHRLVIFAVLLSVGCAASQISFTDSKDNPVVIKQRFGGRGCIAITRNDNGDVEIIVKQDASSDWASIRAIPVTAQAVLTTMFGTRSGENADAPGPTDIGGCGGLFVDPPDEDEDP